MEIEHPQNPDQPRNIEDERRIREYAISLAPHAARLDYKGLFWLAESRAEDGPIRDFATRDFHQDKAEELADLVNYEVWEIQRLLREGEDVQAMRGYNVLIKAVELWDALEEMRGGD